MRKLLVALGGLFICLSAQAQSGTGTITAAGADCTTVTACAANKLSASDTGSVTIQITGTWSMTLQLEASSDGGTTFVAFSCTPLGSSTAVTSASANGTWRCNAASITDVRVRASAFVSGTANISFRSSKAVANAIGGGGTSLPAMSDNGTTVTSTEPIAVPAGTTAANSIQLSGVPGTGIFFAAGTVPAITHSGTQIVQFQNSGGALVDLTSTSGAFRLGTDTYWGRGTAGVWKAGTAISNDAGTVDLATVQYRGLAQTTFVTGDFTTSGSGTALEAITGLTWTFPATTAINARVDCNILYLQNVANAAVAFGFQDASVAPTNLAASGIQYTSATASTEGTLAASTTTTATAVTSATPSAITTIWHAQLHFLIEQPSNASTSVFTIRVSTATAADTVTVKRGSYCSLAQ